MQTLRIGSIDLESEDPMVTKTLSMLKSTFGINIASPSAVKEAGESLAKKAAYCISVGDREQGEEYAHMSQSALQAALVMSRLQPSLLKAPTALLIDAGAVRLQEPSKVAARVITVPAPKQLVLPPGPGTPKVPGVDTSLKAADVQVGIGTGTIVGVAVVGVLGFLGYRALKKRGRA